MFERKLDSSLSVKLSTPQYAPEVYALIEKNREFLKPWFNSISGYRNITDVRTMIVEELRKFAYSQSVNTTIFYDNVAVGTLSFIFIDNVNRVGHLRYWLDEDYTGKGIMTRCVRDLISVGFDDFGLNRISAECLVENHASAALLKRLSFVHEGTSRSVERIGGEFKDHLLFGLLKN